MGVRLLDEKEEGQFLSFILDDETYAMNISQVREVLDMSRITHIPQMPDFMRGVINLRGKVVPIVDLRIKFNMNITEDTVHTCIIIIELPIEGEVTLLGIIADSVKEVLTIQGNTIEAPPRLGTRLHSEFITGMYQNGDEFIILLDIDHVFSLEELLHVQGVNQETEPA